MRLFPRFLLLLFSGSLVAFTPTLRAEVPAASPSPSPSDTVAASIAHPTPVGTWSWFLGPDVTFHPDHTFTDADASGTWTWTDEPNRRLRLNWTTTGSVDNLVLSDDGNHLQGGNNRSNGVSGDRLTPDPAAPAVPPSANPALTGSASPVGVWLWFVGRDITIHDDGTVTQPGQFGTWKWLDQSARRFRINWLTQPYVDTLALSDDGTRLGGVSNRGLEDKTFAVRVLSPLGTWRMNSGNEVAFHEDHSVTYPGHTGFWFWLNESTHLFKIEWSTMSLVDKFVVSDDGNHLTGRNSETMRLSGTRASGPLPVPPPDGVTVVPSASSSPASSPAVGVPSTPSAGSIPAASPTASTITPVGTWRWFYGPNLTFQDDGTVTGTNRDARWAWTDQSKRELRVDYGGRWSPYHDFLTLSEDGNHLDGKNNVDMHITGDRVPAGTDTTPPSATDPTGAWLWSSGGYLTFHPDGTLVTTTNLSGTWKWSDEGKHSLAISWQDGHSDQLTMSSGGDLLQGTNSDGAQVSGERVPAEKAHPSPAAATPAAPIAASARTATATPPASIAVGPVGTWSWFFGPDLTFTADGAVTGAVRPAHWSWTDPAKRALKIEWGSDDPNVDTLTLSADGNTLEGSNDDDMAVSGHRLNPAAAPTADAPSDLAPTGTGSPVGKWRWFKGNPLIFRQDNYVVSSGRLGRWDWTDESKRELKVQWARSTTVDHLTLSADGTHLDGMDTTGTKVSGQRMPLSADASPAATAESAPSQTANPGAAPASPEGRWKWCDGEEIITFQGERVSSNFDHFGTWKWTDDNHRTVEIDWQNIPFVDTLTFSADNDHLRGPNDQSNVIYGDRLPAPTTEH